MAPTIRINISESKVATGNNITTVAANSNNAWTNYNNTASLIDPDKSIGSKVVDSTLGSVGMGVGIAQTADMLTTPAGVAIPPSGQAGFLSAQAAKKLGWIGVGVSFASLVKDSSDLHSEYTDKKKANGDLSKLSAGEVFSALSNFFGTISATAGAVAVTSVAVSGTGVGAVVGLPSAAVSSVVTLGAGVLSVGLGMLGNSMDSNTTIGDALDKGWKYFNDNILSGDYIEKALEKMGDGIIDPMLKGGKAYAELEKEIAKTAKEIWDGIKEGIKKIGEAIEKAAKNAKEGWDNLMEKILDLPDYIAGELPKWLGLNRNGKHYYYDPLVLDLDGDGIETLAHNKKKGAMFDFDNDGVKVATGWVKADDGILVFDRNNDGIINNGGELFGDYTDLKDGTKAKHGFNALADLDSNNDGKITKDDENFAKLKVWRDFNQNGISEADELIGLDTLDITALNIDYQDTNQSLAGGNVLAQLGSYEKSDGSIGTMGDVNFAFNHLYSVYNRDISSNHPQSLPIDMKGSGFVPDLAIAITKSAELKQIVERYVLGGKQEQEALMYSLLKAWAKTDPNYKEFDDSIRMSEAVAANTAGAVAIAGTQSATLLVLSDKTTKMLNDAKSKIGIIDSFLGTRTDKLYYITESDAIKTATAINSIYDKISSSVYNGLYHQVLYAKYTPLFDMIIDVNDDTIDIRYGIETISNEMALKLAQGDDKAGWALVDALELIHYLNANHPSIDSSALFEVVHQFAYNKTAQELQVWLDKLSHFAKQNQVLNIGHDGNDHLTGNLVYGHDGNDYIAGKNGTNWLYGGQGNDSLQANQANDVLDGGDGDDYLNGNGGNDILIGGDGNDNLNAGMGNDILIGGNGNDYLTNYGYGNGADTYIFSGNYGNDRINDNDWNLGESRHKDIVRFTDVKFDDVRLELSLNNRDLIMHTGNGNSLTIEYAVNSDSYVIENFEFMDKAVTFEELYSAKIATIQNTNANDYSYFSNWKGEINGNLGDGDDYFQANTKSTIDGGKGNDNLNGSNFNDTLNGGEGNDTLNSGMGNDILIGGNGNDYLTNYGYGNGNDTYIFSGNYGNDRINDNDWNLGESRHKDIVRFTDVKFDGVRLELSLNNKDLILHTGNGNSLTIHNVVSSDSYVIESFEFADKTATFEELYSKKVSTIQGTNANDYSYFSNWKGEINGNLGDGDDYFQANTKSTINGGAGNDTLNGGNFDDVFDGGDSNDVINAGFGNDTLIGGNGNDILTNYGYDNGADTYIFSGNYGHDTISDYDWNLGENRHKDTIRFTDVKFDDVRLELSLNNKDLILHTGNGNSITIGYAVSSDSYVIESFEFADKTATFEELYSKKVSTIQGTNANDYSYFSNWKGEINGNLADGNDYFQANTKSIINGELGNDTLIGSNFNDVFDGGEGNDTINAGFGDDILIGGAGNDYLTNYGYGNGADTYIFSGNYGNDRINDNDWNLGESRHKDIVRFTDVNFTDVILELSSNGNDLILHTGNDNSLTIEYAARNDSYAIENFEFMDKAITLEELKQSIGTIL